MDWQLDVKLHGSYGRVFWCAVKKLLTHSLCDGVTKGDKISYLCGCFHCLLTHSNLTMLHAALTSCTSASWASEVHNYSRRRSHVSKAWVVETGIKAFSGFSLCENSLCMCVCVHTINQNGWNWNRRTCQRDHSPRLPINIRSKIKVTGSQNATTWRRSSGRREFVLYGVPLLSLRLALVTLQYVVGFWVIAVNHMWIIFCWSTNSERVSLVGELIFLMSI